MFAFIKLQLLQSGIHNVKFLETNVTSTTPASCVLDSAGHKGQDMLVLGRHHSALPEVMAETSQSILISVQPTDAETGQYSSVW